MNKSSSRSPRSRTSSYDKDKYLFNWIDRLEENYSVRKKFVNKFLVNMENDKKLKGNMFGPRRKNERFRKTAKKIENQRQPKSTIRKPKGHKQKQLPLKRTIKIQRKMAKERKTFRGKIEKFSKSSQKGN
jgi:hypothetical protein